MRESEHVRAAERAKRSEGRSKVLLDDVNGRRFKLLRVGGGDGVTTSEFAVFVKADSIRESGKRWR